MSQSLTVSAGTLMLAVPGLIALGGVVVGVALNGWLTTGIEVARLNADNDARTARWLFLRGYRMSPHAGREPVAAIEPAPEPVTGELVAVDGVEVDKDTAEDQHDDSHLGYLVALAVAYVVLAPLAFVRGQAGALWSYVRERWAKLRRKPRGYTGRHWVSDVQHTGAWPLVVPAQREGGDLDA